MSSGSSASASRLSALAPPFNLKNHGAAAATAAPPPPPPPPHNMLIKQDELKLLHYSECNTSPARVFKTSGVSTLPLKPVLPKDLDYCGDASIINNENCSGSHSSAMMGPHSVRNAKDKAVLQVKNPIDKGMEEKNRQVINEAIDPLITETSEPLSSSQNVVSQNVVDDVSLKSHGAKLGVIVQNTSVMSDRDDSDVDSPCWKGTGVSQSTFEVSEPLTSQHSKTETGARKSLNPLAPHFIPESARRLVEYHENEYDGSDSLYFQQTTSSVVSLSSTEHISTAYGTHPSEVSSISGNCHFNGVHNAGKLYVPPNKSTKISLLDYSPADQLELIDRLTSNSQDVMGSNIAGPVKSKKDAIHTGATNVSFTVTRNALTSSCSCSRDAVSSDFNNTLQGASKSTPPKIDVQLLINTMHDLSELLMSNHVDSINEHEHDTILHIINNLYACIPNEVGQRASKPESGHSSTSYSPRKLLDCHKECQVTRMKARSVPHDRGSEKSCCSTFSKKVSISCPRRDGSIKKGDDVTQAMKDSKTLI